MEDWQIYSYLLLLLGLATTVTSYHTETHGTGGEPCKMENGDERKCLYKNAKCVNGECICTGGREGKGDFHCDRPKMFNSHTHNDPILQSMNGEKTDMPLTCRYMLTHFVSEYSGWDNSYCYVQIHIFQSKLRGKVFVEGVDVALKINSPLIPQDVGSISLRKYGNASNGIYNFDEMGQLSYNPDGPFKEEEFLNTYMPGAYIRMTHDPYNNLAKLQVDRCGFSFTFRPADPELGAHQVLIPGTNLNLNPDNNPKFLSVDRALNIPPNQPHHLQKMADHLGISRQQAQIYKAFMSEVPQNQPDAAPQCSVVPDMLEQCPHRRISVAMPTCHFIITRPKVMNCLDSSTNGNTILQYYGECIEAMCTKCRNCCTMLQMKLEKCIRTNGHAEDKEFLKKETCNFSATLKRAKRRKSEAKPSIKNYITK